MSPLNCPFFLCYCWCKKEICVSISKSALFRPQNKTNEIQQYLNVTVNFEPCVQLLQSCLRSRLILKSNSGDDTCEFFCLYPKRDPEKPQNSTPSSSPLRPRNPNLDLSSRTWPFKPIRKLPPPPPRRGHSDPLWPLTSDPSGPDAGLELTLRTRCGVKMFSNWTKLKLSSKSVGLLS